jgi:hypothetical protein
MKNKLTIFAIAAILLLTGVFTAAAQHRAGENNDPQPLPDGNGVMQRFMYRIRDTLGICQGGCILENLTGIMTYDGTNFFIGTVELHFGPSWYITSAMSEIDYDQDGEIELVISELLGLVDTEVTVEGHYQADDWMSVFTINGEVYREPGQPIWASQHHWRWRYRHNQP